MNVRDIVNGQPLYLMVIGGLAIVVVFILLSLRMAMKRARELGFSKAEINKVIKSSVLFSIVPSISIDIGLAGLSTVVGTPWAWFRLSVIGALMYELTSAGMVTGAAGYTDMSEFINGDNVNLVPAIFMVMSISIIFAAVLNIFLGKSYHKGVTKFRAKTGAEGSLIISYFTLAMVMVLSLSQLLKGSVSIAVWVCSFLISFGLVQLAQRTKQGWMKEFVLACALLLSMALSIVFEQILL
uniref:DUF5058 family protein n=1 Tax=Ndongobacter massiliensis TaxID=1871025 RepID=UPI0009303361|nr:DUF5058 family protein [Ndongobacter massiliensis]